MYMDESEHVLQELHFVDQYPILVLPSAWFRNQ